MEIIFTFRDLNIVFRPVTFLRKSQELEMNQERSQRQ